MKLLENLSQYWLTIQGTLAPKLEEELGEYSSKQQLLITVLEMIRIEEHLPSGFGLPGHPLSDRVAVARAFSAQGGLWYAHFPYIIRSLGVWCSSSTSLWLGKKERYSSLLNLFPCVCGIFFKLLPSLLHETLINWRYQEQIVGHISRDSTFIPAREKPTKKETTNEADKPKRKPGRPKKGEKVVKEPTRLQRIEPMSLEEMLEDLTKGLWCWFFDHSKGYKETWIGYKLHIDTADGQVPISCVLTSASTHDRKKAIPLAEITQKRVTNLYDLMDSAYDAEEIQKKSLDLGHVSIINIKDQSNKALKEELEAERSRLELIHFDLPETVRYRSMRTSERVNGRLKDEFGGRHGVNEVMPKSSATSGLVY